MRKPVPGGPNKVIGHRGVGGFGPNRQNAPGRTATTLNRFGSPLVLSRVHWVRPEMIVEVTYGEWTPDGLLRHVVYLGERQDKSPIEVCRNRPRAGET